MEGTAEDEIGDEYDTPGWDQYYGHGRVNAYRPLLSVIRGDVNNDGEINPVDVVILTKYIYKNQGSPELEVCVGNCDCNGLINPVDNVYLVQHVYYGQPPRLICFDYMGL